MRWYHHIIAFFDPDFGYNEIERQAFSNIRLLLKKRGHSRRYIRNHITQVKMFILLPREKRRALVSRAKNEVAKLLSKDQ